MQIYQKILICKQWLFCYTIICRYYLNFLIYLLWKKYFFVSLLESWGVDPAHFAQHCVLENHFGTFLLRDAK